jgi:hypothetical protein
MKSKIYDLMKNIVTWETFFETKDGFTIVGTVTLNPDEIEVTTTAVNGNSSSIAKIATWQGLFSFGRKSMFRSQFNLNSIAAVTAYIVMGNQSGSGTPANQYYGFKVVNNTLYGVVKDGTTENTVALQTITTDSYSVQAEYIPGDSVVFSVNMIKRGKISKNLPLPKLQAQSTLMEIKVTTNETEIKILQSSFFQALVSREFFKNI